MQNILVLCTGNSCRSILGEALINHLAADHFRAFSAGSFPVGKVNENALVTLRRHGFSTDGYSSQSWDEFDTKQIDIIITVCDNAAGETCPVYLRDAIRAHWGLPDPAHVTGEPAVIEEAFEATYDALKLRINKMLALPLSELSNDELAEALNEIGKLE